MTTTKPDFTKLLATAKFPERTVTVALSPDTSIEFRLRALPGRRFRALVGEQPTNDAIYCAIIRACTVDPELTDDEWRCLIGDTKGEAARRAAASEPVEDGTLTDGQFSELAEAAWQLNRGPSA